MSDPYEILAKKILEAWKHTEFVLSKRNAYYINEYRGIFVTCLSQALGAKKTHPLVQARNWVVDPVLDGGSKVDIKPIFPSFVDETGVVITKEKLKTYLIWDEREAKHARELFEIKSLLKEASGIISKTKEQVKINE